MLPIDQGLPSSDQLPEYCYTLPELQYPARLNVGRELVDRHAEGDRADRPAIFFGDECLTYGELQRRVNRLGNGLKALGLGRGDRLLLRLPNVPEWIVTWLACQKLGIVTIATMPMFRARELTYIANDVGATAAVVWGPIRDELEKAQLQAPDLRLLIVAGESRAGDVTWGGLVERHSDRLVAEDTAANDVAMIAYTSGSTGVPKGCVHHHADIVASADTYARYVLTPDENDRFGGHPTLAFTFGTGALMVFPFRFGAATVLMPPFSSDVMLATIQRYRITVCLCAPTSWRLMLRVPDLERRYDLSSLRLCASGGEPLPAATYQAWVERTGVEILEGMGSTELFHNFLSSISGKVRPGATGLTVPGYDCQVVDEEGRAVSDGTPGLLAIKGPTGCKYWRKPDRQAEYVRFGGWNVTGDVVTRDHDGYFRYQCRSDDMIVSGGYKIPGLEIERVLNEHPHVVDSAVIAAPDELRGSVVKAYVVVKPGQEPSRTLAATLQDYVKGELAPYKYPRKIEFVDELPRTATGKIRRVELRQREQARVKLAPSRP